MVTSSGVSEPHALELNLTSEGGVVGHDLTFSLDGGVDLGGLVDDLSKNSFGGFETYTKRGSILLSLPRCESTEHDCEDRDECLGRINHDSIVRVSFDQSSRTPEQHSVNGVLDELGEPVHEA